LNQHVLLTADRVEPLLRGRFGRPYLWRESCSSTQDLLRGTDLSEGAVAVTEHQTAGRGRERRRWEDVPGRSLLLSLLLRPPAGSAAEQLSLVAGLAVAEAVEEHRDDAALKWPNDVLLGGRKVAGVLLEGSEGLVVCGIGINVSQRANELPTGTTITAGSLALFSGHEPDRVEILVMLLEILEHRYDTWQASGLGPFLDELEVRNGLRGRRISVAGQAGIAGRIAPDGRLTILRDDGTSVLVRSGEVSMEQVSD
jgi:BirA family transcriptional regulator, biotin operon repressor / biotin---[acetyl-CoA-carboxylase] ligase